MKALMKIFLINSLVNIIVYGIIWISLKICFLTGASTIIAWFMGACLGNIALAILSGIILLKMKKKKS